MATFLTPHESAGQAEAIFCRYNQGQDTLHTQQPPCSTGFCSTDYDHTRKDAWNCVAACRRLFNLPPCWMWSLYVLCVYIYCVSIVYVLIPQKHIFSSLFISLLPPCCAVWDYPTLGRYCLSEGQREQWRKLVEGGLCVCHSQMLHLNGLPFQYLTSLSVSPPPPSPPERREA